MTPFWGHPGVLKDGTPDPRDRFSVDILAFNVFADI